MNEVWLNVKVTTMVYYDFGWTDYKPAIGDIVEITNRAREKGWITN